MAGQTSKHLVRGWRKALAGEISRNKAAEIFLELGALKYAQGYYAESLFFLEKAKALTELPPKRRIAAAWCRIYLGDYGGALKGLKTLEGREDETAVALAICLQETEKQKAARKVLEKFLEKNPAHHEARLELGRVYEALDEAQKAKELFLELKTEAPDLVDQELERGDKFLAADYTRMAARLYRGVEKIARRDAELFFDLGLRFFTLNLAGDAERVLRKAVSFRPLPKIYRELASFYERTNRVDKALSFINVPLSNFPDDPGLNLTLAKCYFRQGNQEKALAALDKVFEGQDEPHLNAEAYNLKAKALDRLGRYEEAFAAISASKETLKKTDEYQALNLDVPYHNAREMMTEDLSELPSVKPEKPKAKSPRQLVFFLGFPRSGTTLIQTVLERHPDIKTIEEKQVLEAPIRIIKDFKAGYPKGVLSLTAPEIKDLREIYFLEALNFIDFDGTQTLVDKLPLHTLHVPLIKTLFPEARIIFGLRHPYAACWSSLMQHFKLNNSMGNLFSLGKITRFYEMNMAYWQKQNAEMELTCHTVRYEAVIEDLEKETRALCKFLGLEFSKTMLDYSRKAKGGELISTPSYSQVSKPIYRDSLKNWQNYRKYFEPFKDRLAPFLDYFGYSG